MTNNQMHLSRQVVVKKGSDLYSTVDDLSFKCKNLYNSVLYIYRQLFFSAQEDYQLTKIQQKVNYPNWTKICKDFASSKQLDYISVGNTKISQQIVKKASDDWFTFLKSLKHYFKSGNRVQGAGVPRPPRYLHKTEGRSLVIFSNQCFNSKKLSQGILKNTILKEEIKFGSIPGRVKEVRAVPRKGYYKIEVVYETSITPQLIPDQNGLLYSAGIDLGIGIISAIATSNGQGFLIRGNKVKSINDQYNKLISDAQSKLPKGHFVSHKIHRLYRRRDAKIKHEMHYISKLIIETLRDNHISKIYIGKNSNWKQNVNLGKTNNRNFVQIPHSALVHMIEYKGALAGIEVEVTEEAYTSKASAIDKDQLFKYGEKPSDYQFSGNRTSRGLYHSKSGIQCHSDVNGAFNILRKCDSSVDSLVDYPTVVVGCVVRPKVLN